MFTSPNVAQKIVTEIKLIIQRDLNFIDDSGTIIASTDKKRIGTQHQGASQLLKDKSDMLIVSQDNEAEGVKAGVNLPVNLEEQVVGVIGITGPPDEVKDFGRVVKRMTELMLMEIRQQEISNAVEIAKFNFIEQWLFPNTETEENEWRKLRSQSSLLGIDLNVPRIVAVCDYSASGNKEIEPNSFNIESATILKHLRAICKNQQQTICVSVNSRYVVLFAEDNMDTVKRCISAMSAEIKSFFGMQLHWGVSAATYNYREVSKRYREATFACRAAQSSGNRLLEYNLRSPAFLVQLLPKDVLEEMSEQLLEKCTPKETAEITETLALYYKHGGNIADAAAEIFVHYNTFLYRVNKIQEKTGLDIRSPHDSITLYLLSSYNLFKSH